MYGGYYLNLSRSRDVIGHVTIRFTIWSFLYMVDYHIARGSVSTVVRTAFNVYGKRQTLAPPTGNPLSDRHQI